MLKKTLERELRKSRAAILRRVAKIRAELEALAAELKAFALHLSSYREHERDLPNALARVFRISAAEAIHTVKIYQRLARRPLDREALQSLGILPQPPRKAPQKAATPSALISFAKLAAEAREALERNPSAQERELLKSIIHDLQNRL